MRSGLPIVLALNLAFILGCGLNLPGSAQAPCTADALVEAATRSSGTAAGANLRATDFVCEDGYARATLETTKTVTDPATALFRDAEGTWELITIGSAIWDCPQPGVPDDICRVLLGG